VRLPVFALLCAVAGGLAALGIGRAAGLFTAKTTTVAERSPARTVTVKAAPAARARGSSSTGTERSSRMRT
jgi:hypothetical protein